jgi:hypothetical protein
MMDWNLAIEKNRQALKRILVTLVAMIEVGGDRHATLPRHVHRLVLRLLRPAESAARRLIMLASRGLVVALLPSRIAKPKPKSIFVRNGVGTGIVLASSRRPDRSPPRALSLPLLDPLKRRGARPRYVKKANMPRVSLFDDRPFNPLFNRPRQPDPVPSAPSPDDPLDATRLRCRLEAIASVLDDLPRHARRLAYWQARRDAAFARGQSDDVATPGNGNSSRAGAQSGNTSRIRRLSPMRPGRPPGWHRRTGHDVHEVLNEVHGLAAWAMNCPDTS